jgi:raffinose/stachyose/melibiose transport system permease protein
VKRRLNGTSIHVFLLAVVLLNVFPVIWMVSTSLKSQEEVFTSASLVPKKFNWSNYSYAWTNGNFKTFFKNSLIYTSATVAGVVVLASLAAFAFAQAKFFGSQVLFYFFIASMMIPIPGAFIPLYILLLKLDLVNTRLGLILPYINSGLALAIFILKGFFEDIPREIQEAATMDGCGKFGIYWHIFLPLAKPALMTVCIFTALNVWNEFILALVIINDSGLMPIQRGVLEFQGQHFTNYPLLMSALTIATIPILLIYFLMQKQIIKGLAEGALKE